MKSKIFVLTILALFVLTCVAFANTVPPYTPGNTYWVDGTDGTNASGANEGITEGTALKTVAVAVANAILKGAVANPGNTTWGHIIMIKEGTYSELDLSDVALANVTVMSYETDPSKVIIGTSATNVPNVKIVQDNVKVVGVTLQAISGQINSLVEVPGTGGAGDNFLLYNCVLDVNGAQATMTKGAVNLTLAAALTHTTNSNIENCTFDLSDGATQGITIDGAVHTGLKIKGCTFIGKGPLTADLTSKAVVIAATGIFDGVYISGNHLKYTNIQASMHATIHMQLGLKILGNYFEETDGVKIIATVHRYCSSLKIP